MKTKRELILVYSDMVKHLKETHEKVLNPPNGIDFEGIKELICQDKQQFSMNSLMEYVLNIHDGYYKERFSIGEDGLIPFLTVENTVIINKPFEECSDEQLIEFIKNGFVKNKNELK